MPWRSFLHVSSGAALGVWIRWGLGLMLNPVFPTLPLGTRTANLPGGFIIVMSVADPLGFPPPIHLLVTTGFPGGLTTFSAETMTLLLRAQYAWAGGAAARYLRDSPRMTGLRVLLAKAILGD
jgi:CrcB protein